MRSVANSWRRGGSWAWAAVGSVVLVASASGASLTFPPHQQAIIDSLQAINRTQGADSVAARVGQLLPAARLAGDSLFVMRLVGIRGASRVWHRQTKDAREDLDEALALARALGDSATVARTLLWLTRTLEDEGDQARSGEGYRQLEAVGRHLESPYYRGRGLIGMAWDRAYVADYARAESLYAVGCRFAIAARDTFGLLWAQNGLGLCAWSTGRIADADSLFQLVWRQCQGRDMAVIETAVLNNRAGLMEVLGRPDEALRGYQAAHALHERAGRARETVPAALNIVRCLRQLGQVDAAGETIAEVRDLCLASGFLGYLPITMDQLAQIQQDQGRPALAARTCREALAMRDVLRPRSAVQLLLTLAAAMAEQDSLEVALALARRAAAYPEARANVGLHAEVALLQGDLLRRTGDPAAAAAVLDDATGGVAAARLVSPRIALLTGAGEAYLLAGRPALARDRLLAAMRAWEDARVLLDEPVWRERRSGSARRLFEALAELTLAAADSLPPAARLASCFDLLQHFKARTLLERALGPGRAAAGPRPVTAAELQAEVLRPGEVFGDLYLGERRSLLFVATRDTLLVLPLRERAAVVAALSVLEGLIADRAYRRDDDALARLVAGVVDRRHDDLPPVDLAAVLDSATSICWSPDSDLHRLPLGLLLESRELPVARAPSATFLAELRRRPVAARAASTSILAAAGLADGEGRPLPGAAAEIAWLAGHFEGVTAIVDSTEAAPFGGHDPAGFDLLHIAAHAETDAERPWNSALVFGAPGSPSRLRAGDVAELRLAARLAVLTSCGSASGAVISGEGMVGPASGFVSAGVGTVVATLWPIEDRDAPAFSRRFYRELAQGRTAAEALQRTQQWLRGRPETAHPASWAGYVLLGEGRQTVALAERTGIAGRLAATAGAVGAAASIVAALRRRRQRSRVKPQVRSSPSASSLQK
ncbi:MAG TPA: CHAT domain-containing protein [Candidatus Krumholzibacteria bacterium]|nr:CHAT domain-containing protein [Candidatus Krumholzibacteria bacterium]HPD72541.1 CHAT domain-containing protein [Candidatus Krumholzibacteria bacterium]HRY40527.1 CHAT domain-containing protein [Candidatus Krumholzibacteria bacterium]